jgi:GWxTD domain-containing protein
MKLSKTFSSNYPRGVVMAALIGAGMIRAGASQTPMPAELRAGFDLIDRGELDAAETFFEKLHESDKKDVWSITGLGVVYLRRGETSTQVFEILLKLFKQDDTSKAISKFREALKLQPELVEARYYLGRALINKRSANAYAEAATELSNVAQRDSLFRDTRYQLGLAHLGLENWLLALEDFQVALRLAPDDRRPGVKAADALFELGENAPASAMYLDNIRLVGDGEFLEEIFLSMRPLCEKNEIAQFENLPMAEQGAFLRRFWRQRNPTPAEIANPRLREHYRRLKFARANFPMPIKPYYDDRGKVHLRYGPPEQRYISPLYQGNIKSNESWSYEHLQKDLVFDFVEQGGIYREVDDLSQAASAGTPFANRYFIAANLYADRSDLSLLYSRLSMLRSFDTGELASRFGELSAAKHGAQKLASPEKYEHDYHARPLDFDADWAAFRGGNGKTVVEFYFGVAGQRLGYALDDDNKPRAQLEGAIVIEDSLYEEAPPGACTWSQFFLAADSVAFRQSYPVLQHAIEVTPGAYRVTLQLRHPEGNGLGIYRLPCNVRSFASDDLLLSDIQIASSVQPAADGKGIVKHRLSITPHPKKKLQRSAPIYLYYEIYNLSVDGDNRHDYRVEYEARVLRQDRSFFKSIAAIFGDEKKRGVSTAHTQQGSGREAHEYVALDLGNLPKGDIEISLRVTDARSGQTAQTRRQLALKD